MISGSCKLLNVLETMMIISFTESKIYVTTVTIPDWFELLPLIKQACPFFCSERFETLTINSTEFT